MRSCSRDAVPLHRSENRKMPWGSARLSLWRRHIVSGSARGEGGQVDIGKHLEWLWLLSLSREYLRLSPAPFLYSTYGTQVSQGAHGSSSCLGETGIISSRPGFSLPESRAGLSPFNLTAPFLEDIGSSDLVPLMRKSDGAFHSNQFTFLASESFFQWTVVGIKTIPVRN